MHYGDTVSGKRSLCENGKHCAVRLEECSDEEEEGVSGSEEGGAKEDTCMQIASGTDKEATKDAKSSVLEPDQEVPNVLVRLAYHWIDYTLFITITHQICNIFKLMDVA